MSALMQLVAYGAQDIFLTGKPDITLFKTAYKRHTNFSMEDTDIPFNSTPNFCKKSVVQLTRNADLVTQMALLVRLDAVRPSRENGSKFAWVRRLGFALIWSVELT